MKLISLDNLKAFIEKTDNQHDAILTLIVEQVSQRLETALNRKLSKAARTEKFNGGRQRYYVSAYPIDLAQPLTVSVEGTTKTKDVDYWVEEESGLIEFWLETVYSKPMGVSVVYTGGYAVDGTTSVVAVPDDLKRACYMQCAFDFKRRKDLGLNSVTMPDGSVSVESPAELLPEVKAIIKSQRKFPGIR